MDKAANPSGEMAAQATCAQPAAQQQGGQVQHKIAGFDVNFPHKVRALCAAREAIERGKGWLGGGGGVRAGGAPLTHTTQNNHPKQKITSRTACSSCS